MSNAVKMAALTMEKMVILSLLQDESSSHEDVFPHPLGVTGPVTQKDSGAQSLYKM